MLTAWIGWGILVALAAAYVFVPPATFAAPGEYFKEVGRWFMSSVLGIAASAAVCGLVILAIMLIRGQL